MAKSISKARRVNHKPRRYCVILEGLSPALQRQLLKFGRSNVVAANGNLNRIAEAALEVAMIHREFLSNATNKIVRYAKAEGFAPVEYSKLVDSLLVAKK